MFGFLRARFIRWFRQKPPQEREKIKDRVLAFQIGPFGWLVSISCALFFANDLKMLASIYMTDKWNQHWYAQHYENFFGSRRSAAIYGRKTSGINTVPSAC